MAVLRLFLTMAVPEVAVSMIRLKREVESIEKDPIDERPSSVLCVLKIPTTGRTYLPNRC
jgi:hypothetical protein